MLKRLLLRKMAKPVNIIGFPCEISFISLYSQGEEEE